jgi:hypothetical protein
MDVILDPGFVQDLVRFSIEHSVTVGLEALKLGAKRIVTGDD